jgi:segregation and condensation protein B
MMRRFNNDGVLYMGLNELENIIESILFAAGDTVSVKAVATAVQMDIRAVECAINNLSDRYRYEKRGLRIIRVGDGYQMCTNPEYYDYIKKLFQAPPRNRLSGTLLETLAIIAYKQPVTKAAIEEIRGVSADHSVNKLVEYNLVEEKGRADTPGKPILFGTTDEFLRYFGFSTLDSMPVSLDNPDDLRREAEAEADSIVKNR